MNAATADDPIASGFETNAGTFRGGKARSADAKDPKASFRDFLRNRQAHAGAPPKYTPPDEPTPERRAKGDRPKKTKGGFYRAPPPIERLRDRKMLDGHPGISTAMCEAAEKLYRHFYEAGLGGIAAQDLSREVSGGGGSSAAQFPRTERAMQNRQMFREACSVMGWFADFPHRGCGRIVVAVCCYELAVEDAAKIHIGPGRTEVVRGNGLDRLREGLFTLARHWRLISSR